MLNPIFDGKMAKFLTEQGYNWPPKIVVSFSGGKDSTAMLHRLLDDGYPIDDLLFFDTGWEFPEMYRHLAQVMQKTGLDITVLYPKHQFSELLKRYRWPDSLRRWCTGRKMAAYDKYINQKYTDQDYVIHCIGYAEDELNRTDTKTMIKKGRVLYPLLSMYYHNPASTRHIYNEDEAMTEVDALQYCYDLGYTWDGLYDDFDRVSCFCCPLKRKKDIRVIRSKYPDLWARALEMERSIPETDRYVTFRGEESLCQIDDRLSRVADNIGDVVETEEIEMFA